MNVDVQVVVLFIPKRELLTLLFCSTGCLDRYHRLSTFSFLPFGFTQPLHGRHIWKVRYLFNG